MASCTTRRSFIERFGLAVEPPSIKTFTVSSPRDYGPITVFEVRKGMKGDTHLECPFCGAFTRFETLGDQQVQYGQDGGNHSYYRISRCAKCENTAFLTLEYDFGGGDTLEVVGVYPFPKSTPQSFPDSIPPKIRKDFAEAMTCFHASAFKACVTMCRRVVQGIAKQQNTGGDYPKDQIKGMYDGGLITKALFDAAHEIRQFGAFGAHPQDYDALDDITKETAKEICEHTHQFLDHIYIMPAKTAESAKQRQAVKQPGKVD